LFEANFMKTEEEDRAQDEHWVGTWGASPQLTEPGNNPPSPGLSENTLRQFVYVSIGGGKLRIQISNQYGSGPVTVRSVHVAQARDAPSEIDPASDVVLSFRGSESITVQAGEAIYSDPFPFPLKEQSSIAVSMHFSEVSLGICGHPGSRTTSFIQEGNATEAQFVSGASTDHWYYLSRIEVMAPPHGACVVTFGDSITDGRGSTTNGNDRWPDVLSRRLRANRGTERVAVVNAGIGGNRVLRGGLGPTALERFEQDAVGQAGVRWVVLLAGVNDIGESFGTAVVGEMIRAFEWMSETAHAAGLLIYGVPILPFRGNENYDTSERQQAREEINAWIRSSGRLDATLDLDVAVARKLDVTRLRRAYDDGDALHLTASGYRAMGNAVDLELFER
jgi:lysophospholipase L1-like esterase